MGVFTILKAFKIYYFDSSLLVKNRSAAKSLLYWVLLLFWRLLNRGLTVPAKIMKTSASAIFQLRSMAMKRILELNVVQNYKILMTISPLDVYSRQTFITGQVFSKRIEITPQIHVKKFEEQSAWVRGVCCGAFL